MSYGLRRGHLVVTPSCAALPCTGLKRLLGSAAPCTLPTPSVALALACPALPLPALRALPCPAICPAICPAPLCHVCFRSEKGKILGKIAIMFSLDEETVVLCPVSTSRTTNTLSQHRVRGRGRVRARGCWCWCRCRCWCRSRCSLPCQAAWSVKEDKARCTDLHNTRAGAGAGIRHEP